MHVCIDLHHASSPEAGACVIVTHQPVAPALVTCPKLHPRGNSYAVLEAGEPHIIPCLTLHCVAAPCTQTTGAVQVAQGLTGAVSTMAHYISSKFASFETTHALVDRDTGKIISEPVRAATLMATGMPAGHSLAVSLAAFRSLFEVMEEWHISAACTLFAHSVHAGRQEVHVTISH